MVVRKSGLLAYSSRDSCTSGRRAVRALPVAPTHGDNAHTGTRSREILTLGITPPPTS